jgi:hypothetical protein
VAAIIKASVTGAAMFKSVWLSCSRQLFTKNMALHLQDVEKEEFQMDRFKEYMNLMDTHSAGLRAEGHRRGKKNTWIAPLTLFEEMMAFPLSWVADEGELSLWSRVKTILVNTVQWEPYPWEALLYPRGSIEGAPIFLQIPDEVLEPMSNLHDTVHELCTGKAETMESMRDKMLKAREELEGYHVSARLDLHFLEFHAVAVLKRKVVEDTLASVPDAGALDFVEILKNFRAVRRSARVVASDPDTREQLDGLIGLVKNLADASSPSATEFKKLDDVVKQVFTKIVALYTVDYAEEHGVGLSKFLKKTLHGSEAVLHTFAKIQSQAASSPETLALEDIKPLKRFGWLLNSGQWVVLRQLLQRASLNKPGLELQALADKGAKSGECAIIRAHAGAASSSSCAAAVQAAQSPAGYKKGKKDCTERKMKGDILHRFFG